MSTFSLRIYTGETTYLTAGDCLSLLLDREIYTPYELLHGLFLADAAADYTAATRIELLWGGVSIYCGIPDRVEKFQRGGLTFLRIRSKTFTSLLLQNELSKGLHANLTLHDLIYGFCTLPYVTAEENSQIGYIFVKDGTTLWDCVTSFVYKLGGRYPFVENNHVRFTLDAAPALHTPDSSLVTECGSSLDTTSLISCYHMDDFQGNEDVYYEDNPIALQCGIVRNRYLGFDRQFVSAPQQALSFRNRYSSRNVRTQYVSYAGFANEKLGERVTCGQHLRSETICRVRVTFGTQGLRTTLWAYEDGFYNQ